MRIKTYLLDFFTKGHERSIIAKKNIAASFIIKGISILIGLLYVPVTLDYLGVEKYGIWVTIISITTWIGFFDVGLGMGLKNQLSKALAQNDIKLAKEYISTTYAIFVLIFFSLIILIQFISPQINWVKFLNVPKELEKEITLLIIIVLTVFCIRFILQIIVQIFQSLQKVALSNLFNPLSNLIGLIIIFILTKFTIKESLLVFGTIISIIPIIVYFTGSFIFYKSIPINISPNYKFVNFKHTRVLLSLGVQFFIIQISILVLTQSSLILISNLYGPEYVTEYNIAFKYFAIIYMIYSIIIKTFWPAFTEAWIKKEIYWIRKTIKYLIFLWIFLCFLGVFMYLISNNFYAFWIGKEIEISKKLSFFMLLYNLLLTFGGIFSVFLSSINKLRLQLYSYIIGAILFFPLVFIFNKYTSLESIGIIAAMIISSFFYLIAPIQYYFIINKKAKGIWNK